MRPSYVDFRESLEAGRTTCEETTRDFVDRCRRSELNAFVCLDESGALARARELDSCDRRSLPLAGMVVGVKDVINAVGMPITCASKMLESFDSLFDATAVGRLRDAGAIILGKLNCDEFAMGSSNENSVHGPVKNPHDLARVPGGSSGGSAAAVAGGLCHVALGTDTGGSIRQPAAFCGVVGLKPTYGRVSRFGLVAFASSLDSIGPVANCIEDVALTLSAIAGIDPLDATSSAEPVSPASPEADNGQPLRIGIPREYFSTAHSAGLDPAILSDIDRIRDGLASQGADVVDISLPHTEYGIATYYIIASAEASSNLARFDGVRYGFRAQANDELFEGLQQDDAANGPQSTLDAMYTASRTAGFGEEVKRRIMLGTYALSSGYYDAYYDKAQRVRSLIRRDFDSAFAEVDLILAPVTPSPAFRIGEKTADILSMYLSDVYTVPSSLAGLPGLSIPTGRTATGLPIGVQLIGPSFSEATLFEAAGRIMNLV